MRASRCHPCPVVAALNWHLGPAIQNRAVRQGYNRDSEDRMLEACNWQADGYGLFENSCPGNSSRDGWFLPFEESAALTVPRTLFEELGGFDERFRSPGGGLVSLDFFRRSNEHTKSQTSTPCTWVSSPPRPCRSCAPRPKLRTIDTVAEADRHSPNPWGGCNNCDSSSSHALSATRVCPSRTLPSGREAPCASNRPPRTRARGRTPRPTHKGAPTTNHRRALESAD